MTTILVWVRSPWRPRFAFSKASLRDLGGFSAYMLGHRMLFYLQTNADRFLIGRFLGTSALGVYAVAYNTIVQPAARLGGPLQRVFSPAFSRIQDEPERIAATWARVEPDARRRHGPALWPASWSWRRTSCRVVLGDQWDAAVPVVQILAWVGIVQALQSLHVDILMARGRGRTIFRFSIVMCARAHAGVRRRPQVGRRGRRGRLRDLDRRSSRRILTVLAARALGVSPMVFLRAISGAFQAALGMCAAVLAVRLALVDADVGAALRLAACIVAGSGRLRRAAAVARAGAAARRARDRRAAPQRGSAAGGAGGRSSLTHREAVDRR